MKKKIVWVLSLLFVFCQIWIWKNVVDKTAKKKKSSQIQTPCFSTWTSLSEIEHLNILFQGFGIESIIDIPAQDIETLLIKNLKLKRYLGVTQRKEEATQLQMRFGDINLNFCALEISKNMLPRSDLIVCWDYLFSKKCSDIRAALVLFKKSGAKYLLMNHAPKLTKNKKNKKGEIIPINWRLSPYNFPKPILQIQQSQKEGILALWKCEDL